KGLERLRGWYEVAIPIQLVLVRTLIEAGAVDDARRELAAAETTVGNLFPDVYIHTELALTRAALRCETRRPDDLTAAIADLETIGADARKHGLLFFALAADMYRARAELWLGHAAKSNALFDAILADARPGGTAYFGEAIAHARSHDGRW